jgi:hypothetical protein
VIPARAVVVAALAAFVALGVAMFRYESARDQWRAAAIVDHDYDADASDAAYRAVEDAQEWVERFARITAALVVASGMAIGRARPREAARAPTRALWARAIDLGALGLVLVASHLRVGSPAVTQVVDWIVPALLLSLLLGLAVNGASVGQRLFR